MKVTEPERLSLESDSSGHAIARACPSLAIVKYWGKKDSLRNIPATPSLALTLGGLTTETRVDILRDSTSMENGDRVYVGGELQDRQRYSAYFKEIRRFSDGSGTSSKKDSSGFVFLARSESNFPSAAGLASSASGFAALTLAATAALGLNSDKNELSSLARLGSASAARSIWGGFVRLDRGAEAAIPVRNEAWWPELRVVIVQTSTTSKAISSRKAMELTRETSPFYSAWIQDAPRLMEEALEGLEKKDLSILGPVMRSSYMRMFSTMFSASPPIIYWNSLSMELIQRCERLRADGLSAWETMDAGPQVKIFCRETELEGVLAGIENIQGTTIRIAYPGEDARILL